MQFNYKISLSVILLSSIFFISCSSDDDNATTEPLARFVKMVEGRTISFINISENATSYLWDFGDGTTSTLVNPTKRYNENGNFTITLTAFDNNGNSSIYQSEFLLDIDICTEETEENINPANGNLNWSFLTANDDTVFGAFGGTAGFIVENPVVDEVNSSCNVQRFEKTAGCETWAGLGKELATSIDFTDASTSKIFKMKVLAENQLTDVTLRLEFMPFPNVNPNQERVATITELGEWQELTFDFSSVNTGTYKSMIIYFDRDATCTGDVYYFDDIIQE